MNRLRTGDIASTARGDITGEGGDGVGESRLQRNQYRRFQKSTQPFSNLVKWGFTENLINMSILEEHFNRQIVEHAMYCFVLRQFFFVLAAEISTMRIFKLSIDVCKRNQLAAMQKWTDLQKKRQFLFGKMPHNVRCVQCTIENNQSNLLEFDKSF